MGKIDQFLYSKICGKIKLCDWILREDFIFYKIISRYMQSVHDISITIYPPATVFKKFFEIVDDVGRPYFAWLHIFPPHAPYLPPEPYMGMYNSSFKLRSKREQGRIGWNNYFSNESKQDVNYLRDRYDEFIRYCDEEFRNFINQLNKMGQLNNTIVILSSDHGESFEHNYVGHAGPHLYESLVHIPLIIKEPGQVEGIIVPQPVGQVDITVTILDILDKPIPAWMEGASLVPLMRNKNSNHLPVFSMNFEKNPSRGHKIEKGTIAVWEGDYKLIHYLEKDKSLLFNLKQDPGELDNLIDKEPEIAQYLLSLIKEKLRKANERIVKSSR